MVRVLACSAVVVNSLFLSKTNVSTSACSMAASDGCMALNQTLMSVNMAELKQHFTPESIDPECEEPRNAEKDISGLGLTRVYCCETAKAKVAQLTSRTEECANKKISVPCWKSLEKVLPSYLAYYTRLGNQLCATPFPTEAPNGTNATNGSK